MARAPKGAKIVASLREIGLARITLFSLAGIAGAWFALMLAISGITRIKAPQSALAFMPNESTALASRADQLFFLNPKNPPRAVTNMALKALKGQAIHAKSLRILGYASDARGDSAQAERFVRMAARLWSLITSGPVTYSPYSALFEME